MKLRNRKEVGFVRMNKKDLAIIGDGEYKKLLLDLKEKVRLSRLICIGTWGKKLLKNKSNIIGVIVF